MNQALPKTEPETKPQPEVKAEPEVKAGPKVEPKDDKSLLNNDDNAKPGAPEAYADFKVPEGFKLDETVAKEAGALFKELNLDQPSAQKLIDMYVSKTSEAAEAPFKAYTEMRDGWRKEAAADKDIGSKLPEVKATVSRAIDSLGDPALATAFREAMDLTGAGDHPAFIKAFYKLAQAVGEGKAVTGKGPSAFGQRSQDAKPATAAQALYPNLPP